MDDLTIKESVEWCCKNVYISTGISRSVSTRRGTLHNLNEDQSVCGIQLCMAEDIL